MFFKNHSFFVVLFLAQTFSMNLAMDNPEPSSRVVDQYCIRRIRSSVPDYLLMQVRLGSSNSDKIEIAPKDATLKNYKDYVIPLENCQVNEIRKWYNKEQALRRKNKLLLENQCNLIIQRSYFSHITLRIHRHLLECTIDCTELEKICGILVSGNVD
jgi:hypothetical protein